MARADERGAVPVRGERDGAVADPALRGEVEGREEAVANCLWLGATCCPTAPGKMPSVKDALQTIQRILVLGNGCFFFLVLLHDGL
nr:unnamed protein product [Digitaria exilis]